MSKSQKIQKYLAESYDDTLFATDSNGRWCKVWRETNGKMILVAGDDEMPFDYREIHTELSAIEKSMRDFADLRHWVPDN